MSFQEFELLPWKPGWKYEYWNGVAHITPRHRAVTVRAEVSRRRAESSCVLRRVRRGDEGCLAAPYTEAFENTMDYCDHDRAQIADSARKSLRDFFEGKRGSPLAASQIALDERGEIVGAALLTGGVEEPPLMDMLFVAPSRQGRGFATAMTAAACTLLHDAGERFLDSRYVEGNDASEAWHRRFGFVELPDLTLAQSRYRAAHHELWRRGKMGDLCIEEREVLERDLERLRQQVRELEARAETEGWESVHPMLRR